VSEGEIHEGWSNHEDEHQSRAFQSPLDPALFGCCRVGAVVGQRGPLFFGRLARAGERR
jgi:hypothetical protein